MLQSKGYDATLAIWIDHREAKIIDLSGDEARITRIESDADEVPRSFGHVGNQPAHHGFAGDKEKHADHRRRRQLEQFYAKVAEQARSAANGSGLVVLGPGMARKEFEKIASGLADRIRHNEGVDANLTEAQVVAKARDLVGKSPRRAQVR
ncbi:MAG: hypothetical protein ACF8QF_02890 [Phycisphaerales bacterium]